MPLIARIRIAVIVSIVFLLAAIAPAADKPKLVLVIMVDQFRYDYLTRFRADYKGGLDQLLSRGAVFTNAFLDHFPTVTAIGHATVLTGATPGISGIVGNDWWDKETGKMVTSVSDESVATLGGAGGRGASPRRLLVSTVGDELKIATAGASRVIGISLKDRGAILPAGHMGDAAFWLDPKTGEFVSSAYYFEALPDWLKEFNAAQPCRKFLGAKWGERTLPTDASKLSGALEASPFGNDLLEELAERTIEAEQLGQRGVTDLFSVSFSSNDYVGHTWGPDSPEAREVSRRTDEVLAKLFAFVDARIGLNNVLVVLGADHGVAPLPELNQSRRMPGGRMPPGIVQRTLETGLAARYGPGNWIVSPQEYSLSLNGELIQNKKLDPVGVYRTAAELALGIPHVWRVYTRDQLLIGQAQPDPVGRRVVDSFHARRGADIYVLLEPYWMFPQHGTTHGTAFTYDAHVPVIFMGPGVRPGLHHQPVRFNDVAPTLSALLEIEPPSGSVGRPLTEIIESQAR
ncbi:MAG: alkaline phosphatase family protein [Bryobacteraceae bacterium]|nr:alkaline phosphatase family protein [Bryobacteraceae bacterium]